MTRTTIRKDKIVNEPVPVPEGPEEYVKTSKSKSGTGSGTGSFTIVAALFYQHLIVK